MNEIDITVGRKKWHIELPESWAECSPKLYRCVCWLMVKNHFSTPYMRVWLQKYTPMPRKAINLMVESEINAILQCLKWSTKPPVHAQGKFGWWLIWRGPQAAFQNVNGLQYGHADQRFQKYQKCVKSGDFKGSRKALREMCAILLTSFGWSYNSRIADFQATLFKLMPLRLQMAVLYEFWGMTNFLAEHFPLAFKRSKKSSGQDYGWPGMYEAMAGAKFGTVSQVKREKIYDIFLNVEQELQREREMKLKKKRSNI